MTSAVGRANRASIRPNQQLLAQAARLDLDYVLECSRLADVDI
jgi:hypothetical protein